MATETPALTFGDFEAGFLSIPSKPESPIAFQYFYPRINPSSPPFREHQYLIVFINGLGLPAASWLPSISIIHNSAPSYPAMLTYDRFGQGLTTSRDPLDGTLGKELGHDLLDVAKDLHEIVTTIATTKLGVYESSINGINEGGQLQLLLVGASIGAPVSRLYAQHYHWLVVGIILLDSNICNVNYSDILPNPDSLDVDPKDLVAEDCTLEQYREARLKLTSLFDLRVSNREGLNRLNSPELLPCAEKPLLKGLEGEGGKFVGPWLSVVGHDPETFTQQGLGMLGTPKSISERFMNPYWAKYNEGLTKIAGEGRCDGVKIAEGAGHFIQKDNAEFVAKEIIEMTERLKW